MGKGIVITIDRRGELILSVPLECHRELAQHIAEEMYDWIFTRLVKKEMLFRPSRTKEFVTRKSFFFYNYHLQVLSRYDSYTPPLCFQNDWFFLCEDEQVRGQQHFITWYTKQSITWLEQRVPYLAMHVVIKPQSMRVCDLGYRWGSCGRHDILNFHLRKIQLPTTIIDYIVVHELVQLYEPRINAAFWQRVEQAMPDFVKRILWLTENGSRF